MNPYGRLLQLETPKACEKNKDNLPIRERYLHALWAEQKWFNPLKTVSGDSIEVISPGIWNSSPGPDFLKAELKIDGAIVRGDIEIHIKDEAWEQHQHHIDPRYNDVVLHISLFGENSPKAIRKANGTAAEQSYFESALTVSPESLVNLIDLDQYPYKEFLGSGTCAHTLFQQLPDEKIDDFFHQAALWRSRKKYEHLNFFVDDSAEILIAGVCQALGFKQNSALFLELYRYVSRLNVTKEIEMLSLLMQLTGFFNDKYQKLWGADPYYQQLLALAPNEIPRFHLNFTQVRPLNHPLRRLVYLSKFLTDPRRHSIQTQLMNLWDTCDSVQSILKQLKSLIPSYTDDHFEKRYFFENHHSAKRLGLIGEDTINEILLNSFIPFLQNTMNCDADRSKISDLIKAFPHRPTGKFKYLKHRFFGQEKKGTALLRGDLQQGAYQLHKDFCQYYESSCNGCPFVKRYQSTFI